MWFNFFKEIILWLTDLDARLLLIVNGAHSPFFDAVMCQRILCGFCNAFRGINKCSIKIK